MTCLSQLPVELFEIITKYLNIMEFHSLVRSAKYISLGFDENGHLLPQYCTMESYQESISLPFIQSLFKKQSKRSDLSTLMKPDLQYLQSPYLLDLFNHHQYHIIQQYLKLNSDKVRKEEKQQLFWKSTRLGIMEIFDLLVHDKEVDVNLTDSNDWDNAAIQMACANGRLECVQVLLKFPNVDPGANNDWAFEAAAGNGHTEVLKLLLKDSRVNPLAEEHQALYVATENGYIDCVKLLLSDPRIDPSFDYNKGLRYGIREGKADMVKAYLNCERCTLDWVNSAIQEAVYHKRMEAVELVKADSRFVTRLDTKIN
ncbi:hypothetical protein BC833DRAFT_651745 [Globomyces pollinis-pini]|nr:hypothetical protein BC833DRAFT_651745 [Globomyces pollinis-pini]